MRHINKHTCSRAVTSKWKTALSPGVSLSADAPEIPRRCCPCHRRPVEEVIPILSGIDCGGRGTSCPDQLAKGLQEYLNTTSGQEV